MLCRLHFNQLLLLSVPSFEPLFPRTGFACIRENMSETGEKNNGLLVPAEKMSETEGTGEKNGELVQAVEPALDGPTTNTVPTKPPPAHVTHTNPTHVSITVKAQNGKETFFKIKRDTELKKLLKSYCQKFFLDYQATSFYLEGQHFNHIKTPNELNLEDVVEIQAMTDMLGGGLLK